MESGVLKVMAIHFEFVREELVSPTGKTPVNAVGFILFTKASVTLFQVLS